MLSLEELGKQIQVEFNISKPVASPGLSTAEAKERLEKYGPNCLSPPKKKHPLIQFIEFLMGLFNVMLLVSGIAAYVTYAIDKIGNASNVDLIDVGVYRGYFIGGCIH